MSWYWRALLLGPLGYAVTCLVTHLALTVMDRNDPDYPWDEFDAVEEQ